MNIYVTIGFILLVPLVYFGLREISKDLVSFIRYLMWVSVDEKKIMILYWVSILGLLLIAYGIFIEFP